MKKTNLILLALITLFQFSLSAQTTTYLDPNFGIGGKVITRMSSISHSENLAEILLQPDGKIISAGHFNYPNAPSPSNGTDFVLLRHKSNGQIDSTFGTNGRVIYNFSQVNNQSEFLEAAALQNDGKIVCVGVMETTAYLRMFLTRLLPNGAIDSTFGLNGVATVQPISSAPDVGSSILILSNGKILVGGFSRHVNKGFVLRYNPNGILDSTFGTNGSCYLNIPVNDLALQSNGKILAVGEYNPTSPWWWYNGIVRINSVGVIDSTFGINGFRYFDHTNVAGSTFWSPWVTTIEVQPDDKILIGGGCELSTHVPGAMDTKYAIARLTSNGSMDSTFGNIGRTVINLPGNFERVRDFTIQPDGKIFVTGSTSSWDFEIIRINPNGSIDQTFNNSGRLSIDIAGGPDGVSNTILQPDGKLLISGQAQDTTNIPWKDNLGIVRILTSLNVGVIELNNEPREGLIYPNPIDQNSILEYSLKNTETITINLFDLNGRHIKTFLNEQDQAPGTHKLKLEFPENLPKAVYFIKISSPQGHQAIRIVK